MLPEFVCWLAEYENNWEGPVDSLNWCLYNILLIKFISDVAYGIGLGGIYNESWTRALRLGRSGRKSHRGSVPDNRSRCKQPRFSEHLFSL